MDETRVYEDATIINVTIRMVIVGDQDKAYAALVDALAVAPVANEVAESQIVSWETADVQDGTLYWA